MTTAERFWAKVKKGEGCWEWLGAKKSHDPKRAYGQFYFHGKTVPASKVAWELVNEWRFPEGMDACHSCDNPSCVNPSHIFPGTAKDNAADAIRKGRYWDQSKKTHCKYGHPFSGSNLHITPRGERRCRQCTKELSRKARAIRKVASRTPPQKPEWRCVCGGEVKDPKPHFMFHGSLAHWTGDHWCGPVEKQGDAP